MAITNGYVTLDELKHALGGSFVASTDDAAMELAIESASRLIDEETETRFWADADAVARVYTPENRRYLDVDGISTTDGLAIKTDDDYDGIYETTWTTDEYRLEPSNAVADGEPFTRIVAVGPNQWFNPGPVSVEVTAKGGWPTVPPAIRQATLILALRLYKRKDSPFGISGSPEYQGEMRLVSPIDSDVRALVKPYRRFWAVR